MSDSKRIIRGIVSTKVRCTLTETDRVWSTTAACATTCNIASHREDDDGDASGDSVDGDGDDAELHGAIWVGIPWIIIVRISGLFAAATRICRAQIAIDTLAALEMGGDHKESKRSPSASWEGACGLLVDDNDITGCSSCCAGGMSVSC